MDKNAKIEELAGTLAIQRLAAEIHVDINRATLADGEHPHPEFRLLVNRIYRHLHGPIEGGVPSLLARAVLHCHKLPERTWDVLWHDGEEEKYSARTHGELAIAIERRIRSVNDLNVQVGIRPVTREGFESGTGYAENRYAGMHSFSFSPVPADEEVTA